MMIASGTLRGLLIVMLFTHTRQIISQINVGADQNLTSYRLKVPVDEVSLNFHATDPHGLAVNDLKLDELKLLDNGRPPMKVATFQLEEDSSIRGGILMDTSESMRALIARNRAISTEYAQRILRTQTDQAFVMGFAYASKIVQAWTSNPTALAAGVRGVRAGGENPLGGTAMLDAVYHACFFEFGKVDRSKTGNFILLFSDGEDNASRMSLPEVVDACQRAHTAVYSFRGESSFFSGGATTLAELAAKTGGRVFHDNGSEAEIYDDLRTIEADLRSQYWLVYKPAGLKHDGTFHRIELRGPERVDAIVVRSGYYAPAR